MKTTINTAAKTITVKTHLEGLRENNGGKKQLFGISKTTDACGYSFDVKLPFLFLMINFFKN